MTLQPGVPDSITGWVLDGRYRVEALVARGGMATVYRGSDLRLQRTVAIKVMHPNFASDPGFVERFEREARAAARLSNAHVVSVHDQGHDQGLTYLVMEFVPGHTVRDVLRSQGRLDPPHALAILDPVLQALDAAHRAGYVHRDVKPENVLISTDGQVKVTDFGLARAIEGTDSHKTSGLLLGTVAYLSPEHVEHDRTDARSDVYGAGILLFEMLTGRVPFTAAAPMQVAYRHVHEDVPAPSTVEPSLPAELDALVARATRRQPAQRFPDAAAFLADVRRLRERLPAGATWQPTPRDTLVVGLVQPLPPPPPAPGPASPAHRPANPAGGSTTSGQQAAAAPWGADEWAPSRRDEEDDLVLADWLSAPARGASAPGPARATSGAVVTAGPAIPGEWSQRQPADEQPRPAADLFPDLDDGWAQETGHPIVEPAPARRRRPRARWIALVAVICVGALVALMFGPLRRVEVPDVLDKSAKQAATLISAADLQLDANRRDYSETVKKGRVISTDPTPGSSVRAGSTIVAVISRGPERYDVPKLAGLTADQARAALEAVKLKLGRPVEVYHDDVKSGSIVKSAPRAGKSVKPGTEVDVQVSKGPMPVALPVLEGTDAKAAIARIKALGLKTSVTSEISTTVPRGMVIRLDPKGGTTVPHGSTVKLVESKGPPMVAVPTVVGKSTDQARAALEAAGFSVQVRYPLVVGVLNKVQKQSPAGGTLAPKGSTVSIDVV